MNKSPRILIVNAQSLYKDNATGITMRSIFEKLPAQSLLEVTRDRMIGECQGSHDIRSIPLPEDAMKFNYFLRRLLKKNTSYNIKVEEVGTTPVAADKTKGIKRRIRDCMKAISETSGIYPDKDFLKTVDEFSPDYIYTIGSSFFVHQWALYFAKRYNIQIVIHYMDNWRETMYRKEDGLLPHWIFQRQLRRIEDNMHCGLTISQSMADAYHKDYGHEYMALMNTVEPFEVVSKEHAGLNAVYAGGLHLGRDQSLHELALSLAESGYHTIAYTPLADRKAYLSRFGDDSVEFRDYLPHEQVRDIFSDADVMLHIESFDPQTIQFTKYSLSTKIPEYMMSGKPILCYAPEQLASYQHICSNHCGICVKEKKEFVNALCILNDRTIRETYGKSGRLCAVYYHSENLLERIIQKVFMRKTEC